jgi:BON domain-containing protein
MKRFQLAGIAAVALLSFGSACTKPGPSDETISNDIKAKLYSDATTKAANINVAVKDGAVTLSGDVPSSDVELEAMKVANGAPGVRGVADQLKVNTAMATPNQLPDAGSPPPAGQAATTPPPVNPAPAAAPERERSQPVSQPGPTGAPVATAAVRREASEPAKLTVPAGATAAVRMIDSIDSSKNTEGQVFRASLSDPLMSGSRVVVPAGANASVLLAGARGAGRIKGNASLEVRLASIEYNGESYKVDSSSVQEVGKGGRGKSTAVRTGIGAAAGAVIGALAGGGKGAAIGSMAGGGAGFGVNALTHGSQVKIPSETVLTFTLQAPLTVTKARR